MPRSAGFAICSPQGIGEPHNAPRASQHLSYVPICSTGRGSQGRHHGALIQLKSRCEFRCDFHATPRCFRASELRHRCPEPRVIATGCRNSVPYRVAWGSGGRGFKSRRPDWVKNQSRNDLRPGLFLRRARGVSNAVSFLRFYPLAARAGRIGPPPLRRKRPLALLMAESRRYVPLC